MSTSSSGPLPRSAEGAIGARLGRYELLAPIAAGGMAEVFVARALGEGGFQRLVAIKRILPELANDERFVDMFLDEGRLAGLVSSPNVVQVLDVARTDEGTLYMVLELVRGVALHRLLRAAKLRGAVLPTPVLVGILAQAADGLAAAHGALSPEGEPMNIVHRDVSPQNLLVGIDGRARLADFGVARALHRRSTTDPGELRGKLGYFAPEQIQGRPATPRSDVFALSVVAWEAFAGVRLFRGETPHETLRAIRLHEPAPLHTLRADVPAALAAVVARGLAKRPEARLGSAHELALALREAVPEAPASAIAGVVRDLVGPLVEELDAQIRHALDAAETTMRRAPPPRPRDTEPVDDATALFEVDADTTTTLREPAPAPVVATVEPTSAGPVRKSWPARWVMAAVASTLVLAALLAASSGASPASDASVSPATTLTSSGQAPPARSAPPAAAIGTPTSNDPEPPTTSTPPAPAPSAPAPTALPEPQPATGGASATEPTRPPRSSTRARRAARAEQSPPPPTPTSSTRGLRSSEDFARTLRGAGTR